MPDEKFIDRRIFVSEQIDPESDSEEDMADLDKLENNRTNKAKGENPLSSKNVTLSSIYGKKTL